MTITTKKFHEFPNPAALDDRLASEITNLLVEAIQERGHANLGVSGGRTPTGLFAMLRERAIDWRRVNICLVDERWVKTSSRDSNERTLRETLLVGEAAN